jgi:ribosomal protein S18 acetylase RimI-like enzyme
MNRQAVRTYLEMTDRSALDGDPVAPAGAVLGRDTTGDPALWRRLYTGVGRDYHWVDRLPWTDEDIVTYLADPALEFWVLRVEGELAGYFELRRHDDGAVEVAYFGLLPGFTGRGLGRFMLTKAVERAWERGANRVWLHTSSLDHSSALSNYLARGFSIWKQETYEVQPRPDASG